MNHFRRRCGCGAIFALVHLRDRSTECRACQRHRAFKLDLKRLERGTFAAPAKVTKTRDAVFECLYLGRWLTQLDKEPSDATQEG